MKEVASVEELEKEISEKKIVEEDGIVIIDFYTTWCAPCRLLEPVLEEVERKLPEVMSGRPFKVLRVNIEVLPAGFLKENKITVVPTLVVFRPRTGKGYRIEGFYDQVGADIIDAVLRLLQEPRTA